MTGSNPKGLRTASRLAEIGPDGSISGYNDVRFSYDDRKRPIQTRMRYKDGFILTEDTEYGFAGEVLSSVFTYSSPQNIISKLSQDYTYDNRGRILSESATLYKDVGSNVIALKRYSYDDIGHISGTTIETPGRVSLTADMDYTLQGWTSLKEVLLNGDPLFVENLTYDGESPVDEVMPLYTGMVSGKENVWFKNNNVISQSVRGYTYDHAGRLLSEISELASTDFTYDSRGNVLSVSRGDEMTSYAYSGDRLNSLITGTTSPLLFTHDSLGRMTYNGQTGQSIFYNDLDLVGNISRDGTTLVNYFYLADGTKLSALKENGSGLLYRGPFVFRKGTGSSSLTLESAAFGGGRLTPRGAMFYVTDYLGSVRAVVDGTSGAVYEASDYSAFGDESAVPLMQSGSVPAVITLRDAYTGKESQTPDFSTGYTDFGARQYSPTLRRWMTPDPLSEKYYGVSPYAFCNNNPVNFVDPDGKYIDKASRREWNNNKRIIQEKIDNLEYLASMWEGTKNSSIVDGLNQQIAGIKQTLSTMKVIEQSEQGYKLSALDSPLGKVVLDTESGLIDIQYISENIGNFVHEVTHAGQFESGDIGFDKETGCTYAQDIYDEIEAYKAEAYYVGVDSKLITKQYVQNLTDSSGNKIYTLFGPGRVSPLKVTVRSPLYHVYTAYGLQPTPSILPFYRAVQMLYKQ